MTERILFAPGGATEAKQDAVLAALTYLSALATEQGLDEAAAAITLAIDEATAGLATEATAQAIVDAIGSIPAPADISALSTEATSEAILLALGGTATEATLAQILTALGTLATETGQTAAAAAIVDAIEAIPAPTPTDVSDLATEATLAEVLNALGPLATEAGQVDAAALIVSAITTLAATELLTRALTLETDSVRTTLRPSLPLSQSVTGPVVAQTLVTPPPGGRIRLLRNAGHADPLGDPEVYPLVTLTLGGQVLYRDRLEAGLPWSETVCFEGAPDASLAISLDAGLVYLNLRYEVVAP